jgi:hypothetical protein
MYCPIINNRFERAIVIQALVIILVSLPAFSLISSCYPQQDFGELLICSDIDGLTSELDGIGSEYSIDSGQIVAAIDITGARGSDVWLFIWENIDTGEIIAESSGNYSNSPAGIVEGYLSNKLLKDEGNPIIIPPGDYRVSFYHNNGLLRTSDFTIKRPDISILDFNFYKGVDNNGNPSGPAKVFSQNEQIYAAMKLNYEIEGDCYIIEWFNDGRLLGEEEYIVRKSCYVPGYIIFKLIDKEQGPLPVGNYNARVSSSGLVLGEYTFEMNPVAFAEDIFAGRNYYQDDDYNFSVIYPDVWSIDKIDMESGIKIRVSPLDDIKKIIINMWVLKEGYYPEEEDFSVFADKLLAEQTGEQAERVLSKTQKEKSMGDISIYEITYDNTGKGKDGWQITFSFLKRNNVLFLFMRLTDFFYIDYAEKVTDYMIDSIKITE